MKKICAISIIIFICSIFTVCGQVVGDVNGDNVISINDALLVARYAAGLNPSGFITANGDTDGNGAVNILDALLIARYSAGLITTFPGSTTGKDLLYTGVRSSSYGIEPFPGTAGWEKAMQAMTANFTGTIPCAVWIVGELQDNGCHLFFPSPGGSYTNITFANNDKHEPYLTYFDNAGIKVYLQIESGNADVMTLIDLVLKRYSKHPSVVGFGVDVEWFQEPQYPGYGKKVDDVTASAWETAVKKHNPGYQLFLKHWDRAWMPPNYRGNILFITDSQGFNSLQGLVEEMCMYWADYFAPNQVGFQIGYEADKKWWGNLNNPPATIGKALAQQTKQTCSIFWVDFTLRDVLPVN